MSDLVGIQITDLTPTPSINGSTEFPIQRPGVTKAEKVTLNTMSYFIVSTEAFSGYLNDGIAERVQQHVSGSDPHGDRAYTNTVISNHRTDVDPHGDRAFATQAIQNHKEASDPHGDRLYALNTANTAIDNHKVDTDPHGDRAFASSKLVEAKQYTDNKILTDVTNKIGVSIAPLVSGKVPAMYMTKVLEINSRLAFPAQGSQDVLYIDTSGNDIYRWNGTDYINLTPAVNIDNITLTTDSVEEGDNPDRRYLTTVLKDKYDAKLDNVTTDVEDVNQSLIASNNEPEIKLKGIKADTGIFVKDDGINSLLISDDTYNYETITEGTEEIQLDFDSEVKTDLLESLDTSSIYKITGNVLSLAYKKVDDIAYVLNSEKFDIETVVGLEGELEEVITPTNVTINSTGAVITGNGPANKQIKAHNSNMTEVGIGYVLENGTFSINLSAPIVDGSPIYLYTVDGNGQSDTVIIYSPRINLLRDTSIVSIDSTGLIVKGQSEKTAIITITKQGETPTDIGTGTCDSNGFFTVTVSEELINGEEIKIKAVYGTATKESIHEVNRQQYTALHEVELNSDRTILKGKGAPNSIITVFEDGVETNYITINETGVFEEEVTISTTINKITLGVDKTITIVEEEVPQETIVSYDYDFYLLPYYDTTIVEPSILKVATSSYSKMHEKITREKNKTNFNLTLALVDNALKVLVSNTEGIETKWVGRFKINTIEL